MRYLLYESDRPVSTDYYYECRKTTNDHFPKIYAHTHDFYEIYIYLSGPVKLFIEDRIYNVKRGDIVVVPPFTIHQLLPASPDAINQEYDRIYMYITTACLSSFQFNEHSLLQPFELAKQRKRYHFQISDSHDFEQIFQCMMAVYQNSNTEFYGKEMLNRAQILQGVTLLNKHILSDMEPRKTTHVNPLIDKVLSYINENYAQPLTLESIASHFFMNKYTLSKLFKMQTDRTLHNYILLKRITMAKQKITEGCAPSAVYLEVGFKDYSTFYRAFLKMEKISPKEFARFTHPQNDEPTSISLE